MKESNIILDKIIGIEKILNKLLNLDEKIDNVEKSLNEKIDNVEKRLNEKIDEISKRQDRQEERLLVFEHDFGRKIDMILDAVLLEQEKNIEKSQKIKKLDSRVEKNEINILEVQGKVFNLERRVCNLENNSL